MLKAVTVSKLLNTLAEMGLINFVVEESIDDKRAVLEKSLLEKAEALSIKPKILLVEDNITNQIVIKELLAIYKFDFVIANNGQEAVDIVKTEKFDLVLMDLQMPVMDGFEATRKIRQFKSKIELPILALSAAIFSEDIEHSSNVGMNDHLKKPIEMEKLLLALLTWIPFYRLQKAEASARNGESTQEISQGQNKPPTKPTGNTVSIDRILPDEKIIELLEKKAYFDYSGTVLPELGPESLLSIVKLFSDEYQNLTQQDYSEIA